MTYTGDVSVSLPESIEHASMQVMKIPIANQVPSTEGQSFEISRPSSILEKDEIKKNKRISHVIDGNQ